MFGAFGVKSEMQHVEFRMASQGFAWSRLSFPKAWRFVFGRRLGRAVSVPSLQELALDAAPTEDDVSTDLVNMLKYRTRSRSVHRKTWKSVV